MTRMKQYVATAAVAAVLAAVPTGAYAAERTAPQRGAVAAPAEQGATTSPIRTVRSGERVDTGRGYTLWLTPQGKHWSDPDGVENFRSVVDGNIDRSRPGVSHQSEGDRNGMFHSGVFYGAKKAARVELVAADGTRTPASLVRLPGNPDWGAWYVHTPPATGESGPGVALYDRSGRLLAELPVRDF
ncbi:hypothetical protein [Streptomyces kanasensis]|uniref:hypothetical protein n=1 Tax=Streptomyces kanasensis TaxID=936756 RepID=UPI0037001A5F